MNQKFNKIITTMGLIKGLMNFFDDAGIVDLEQSVLKDKQHIAYAKTASDKAYWKSQLVKDQANLKMLKQRRKK